MAEARKSQKGRSLWSIVLIELTGHCNFSCSFCPIETMIRRKTAMPLRLWEKILRELGEQRLTKTVFFHVLGEPLLHPQIYGAIRLANELDLAVSLYTNGGLLNKGRAEKLIHTLKKGRFVISLQDISPEGFAKRSRNTLSWEKYMQRLAGFLKIVETVGSSAPAQLHCMVDIRKLGWSLARILREQRRIQLVYDYWCATLGHTAKQSINLFKPANAYPLGRKTSFFVKYAGNWDNQLLDPDLDVIPHNFGHCAVMNDTFAVLSDGTCTFCCNDYDGQLNLGNAEHETLLEIFNGPRSMAIREAEEAGRFVEERCRVCRGRIVYKASKKPAGTRNLVSDYFLFREHLRRHGARSTLKKTNEAVRKRLRAFL